MTPEQFSYWFKGACDVIDGAPTPEQWAIIHKAADDVVGPLKSAEKPRKLSRFEYEETRYRKAGIANVNNYVAIGLDGKMKPSLGT